jgi:nucleotide-binding universal stress UspA family protein
MKLVRIVLPIDHQGTTEACKKAAFGVAKRFGLSVEILHPCAAPWQRLPYSTELSPFYSDDLIELAREQVAREESDAKAWFDRVSQGDTGIRTEFVSLEGFVMQVVATRARVADMTMVPSIGAKEDAFWDAAREGALILSGRPMLVVPDGSASEIGESVVIAWKDGVEAVRAVAAAAPFLDKAKAISLVAVQEGEIEDPTLAAMAGYLKLAGLKVEAKTLPASASEDIGEAILLEAASRAGPLLVMGAYGHWRWREWAFGGVTEHVLRNATLPVLMAH